MTNKEASNMYLGMAVKVAKAICGLNEELMVAKSISEEMEDNADPEADLEEALRFLGQALASIVVYMDEYRNENKGGK